MMLLRLMPLPRAVIGIRLSGPSSCCTPVLGLHFQSRILQCFHLFMIMAGQVNSIFESKSFVELPSQGWLIFNFRLGSEIAQLNESRMIVFDGLVVPLLQVRKFVSQVLSNSPRKEFDVESPNELIPCVSLRSTSSGHALPPFISL